MNVLRADAYLKRLGGHEKLSDIYEDDEMLQESLAAMLPGFEFLDYSHLSIQELRARYFQAPRSLEPAS